MLFLDVAAEASLTIFGVLGVCLLLVWLGLLVYLDIFTPRDVKRWRQLSAMRGYGGASGVEKVAAFGPSMERVQKELDLERMLAITNRPDTPSAFLVKALIGGILGGGGFLALDIGWKLTQGNWWLGFPPWLCVGIFLAVIGLRILSLRSAVAKRRAIVNRGLGDMLMLVAVMTSGRGLQLEDAMKILSRCLTTPEIKSILEDRTWHRLIKDTPKTTVELYERLSEEYGIPMFRSIAEAASNTNVGFGEKDTYTRLAKSVYEQRLAEARQQAARAKIWVTMPVAGMLIPLLILLGAPAVASVSSALK